MELLNIKNLDLENKKVFIRCDFNIPMDEFENISDDRRIRSAVATINYCIDQNCAIILASHLGRPDGKVNTKYSLAPVARRLHQILKREIVLAKDVVGEDAISKAKALQPTQILLLENLRFEAGETENDKNLSQKLASMAEFYINDAFGVSHRAHSSVEGITHFFDEKHKAAGFLLQKEMLFFGKLIKNPVRPFAAIVGGSKVSGKLEALINLLPQVDKVLIGGGMAFTFLKQMGYDVGASLVEDDLLADAQHIMDEAKKLGVKFYLPIDVVAAEKFAADSISKLVSAQEIPKGWMGLDIGPATVRLYREVLSDVQTVLWNGPMGVYEMDKFARGSSKIAHFVADSYATTVVGGGDTADLVQRIGLDDEMTFISTGGGASLELLEGKVLPGVLPLIATEE
ncbi:MAG: phosphoglycerate kinase [Epsilonproteobacteria bacterium]|nr:phosphoglycerate kinase [Campylobacterota bacterium]OIO14122.1 MAG: phosphoglycerate kinase [Helicobacteraceae bacterium CG1_02_36_14]PIP09695.1 MAG: phosphoglycerate kinase [Sulfurimonas sp. CG23_combo_of_CG06-09_8_20_14_all_36_33]PIS26240.1 MAG: phosphoglycerate kinase [Sulfurimonas sp. CG08_land_8_20_14_0_20_36_33]PIU34324.1 MAG: phosphoglycerate kinase [Sulfurimonas sp. CG07_land_8_20_14_0_80_36_56]PIV02622.1 MAG: phosphoglycerate kinase [Sulfurimonas sp. CG03_land_8_20_14_0_80_36_25]P